MILLIYHGELVDLQFAAIVQKDIKLWSQV